MTLADEIAFTIAAQGKGRGDGAVYAHVQGESILKHPQTILTTWQIQNRELVRVAETVYRDVLYAPAQGDLDAKPDSRIALPVCSFVITKIKPDHVEAEISYVYGAVPGSPRRGGYAEIAHFDKTGGNVWSIKTVHSLLRWD